jgi:phage/plasmid-associated DNA primase
MAETKAAIPQDPLAALPAAKDIMKQMALKEAEKASAALREMTAAEAEKQALLERFSKASGVSDEDRLARAAAIIKRAADNGMTEILIVRFPNELCTDHGRAINQGEQGWENTLTGLPKELFEFWQKYMKPRGYRLRFQIVDFPGGIPGDVGVTLSWS